MTLSRSQRRSWYRHGAADLNRTIDAAKAAIAADEAAKQERLRAAVAEARQAERDRPKLTAADVKGATHVRDQFGWHEVVRVNAKSVTVKTGYSWTERLPLDRVLEARTIEVSG